MTIQLIVFDMAGTTVMDKQNVAEIMKSAMAAFNYEVAIENINPVMGYPKPIAIRSLLEQYADAEAANDTVLVNAIHDLFVQSSLQYYEQDKDVREKDSAKEVFTTLKKMGIKIALDTGFSRVIADTIIERLGWKQGEHYDICITSDEVANGRPHPDMIFKAMDLLDIASVKNVAKVGDTLSDLQEGNAAGCNYVIGITTGAYTADELANEKHTHLINRLGEVISIVSES